MMNDFELRELDCISNCENLNDVEIEWSFFALFSNIIEKLNGGVSYVW